jgi:hypothetical protein
MKHGTERNVSAKGIDSGAAQDIKQDIKKRFKQQMR